MVVMSLEEKIAVTNYTVNIPYQVIVTAVHHPSKFYVRPAVITEDDLNKLAIPGKRVPFTELEDEKLVIYYSDTKQKMIRGQINMNMEFEISETFIIFAIDYGFYDTSVPYKKIYNWKGDRKVGPLAMSCRLINCYPKGTSVWPQDVREEFQAAIDSQPTLFIQIQSLRPEYMWVDLYAFNLMNIGKWLIESDMAATAIWYKQIHTTQAETREVTLPDPEFD